MPQVNKVFEQAIVHASEPGRLIELDILRGFALLGILFINVNVTAFVAPGAPPGLVYQGSLTDQLVLTGLILLVESKFFTLFSLLFGLGFALQVSKESA